MIQLRSDCLEFETGNGETIPCSVHTVTVELMGASAKWLDPDIISNAAAAVLHYFKHDLQRPHVTVREFASVLETVLSSMGLDVQPAEVPSGDFRVIESDLRLLAPEGDEGLELLFFDKLRNEILHQMKSEPSVLRFRQTRQTVKTLTRAKRWCPRCQRLRDAIVEFLRETWDRYSDNPSCVLVVD